MFEVLFTFSGRLNRGQFALWATLQCGVVVLFVYGVQFYSVDITRMLRIGNSLASQLPSIAIIALLGLGLVLLPISALLVKRLRDVGLPAWPSFLGLTVIVALLAVPILYLANVTAGLYGCLAFTAVIVVLLAFIPSSADGSDDNASENVDPVERFLLAQAEMARERRLKDIMTASKPTEVIVRSRPDVAPKLKPAEPGFGRRH